MDQCIEGKHILELILALPDVCPCNDSVMNCQKSKYTAPPPNHMRFKATVIMLSQLQRNVWWPGDTE